ncbi:MBL fold metallo-hydrolase [Nonomuraea sp. KC401]|uniref:MBL fold metallo-hydrolase n=1 Tax=unclassified Nonomuraea TaxID=2593643 RepID=UPI0010FDFFF6|nr:MULTISPECIES: MBL fold metallo-hydrolase [unclassified Nonomuraea]NBE97272.1 MBL fold metallo-hydrolase [Nonomuraea sp. K271]TLF65869.1 MBL fold metallo-hydrolase [Nonomuraea sp. KC401]
MSIDQPSRRSLIRNAATAGLAGAAAALAVPPAIAAADPRREPAVTLSGDVTGYNTRVLLLGTSGGPVQVPGRTMISSAVAVGDRFYLVDAGSGAVRQAALAGISLPKLGAVFITHGHSDHLADLFNLVWLAQGPPAPPLPIYGPGPAGHLPAPSGNAPVPVLNPGHPTPGLRDVFTGWLAAATYDINIRNNENGPPGQDFTRKFAVHEIMPPPAAGASPEHTAPDMPPFTVFEDDRVRVSAILVPHGRVFPSYAYRFQTDDGSVTFSGDTARSDNVARLAADTDILVHEAVDIDHYRDQGLPDGALEHMRLAHTSPEDVGRVAAEASVRRVLLNHLTPGDPAAVPDAEWERRVRATYGGSVCAGHDLTAFGVGRRG